MYKENRHILDGRFLFSFLCIDIIEYILKINNSNIEEVEITFLANYIDDVMENNIFLLAQKCKLLNIITNNSEKFINISGKLQEDLGIMIRVSKNKRKGLLKSGIVVNYDFPLELIDRCNFNNEAVLININEKINKISKAFNGIIINDYEINEQPSNMREFVRNEIIYESKIYKQGSFDTIRAKMRQDNVRVKNLIGINGKINSREFSKNVLTKMKY